MPDTGTAACLRSQNLTTVLAALELARSWLCGRKRIEVTLFGADEALEVLRPRRPLPPAATGSACAACKAS